jgi:hypothetical protein
MPIWCVPLSHQIAYILHLFSLSVCNNFVEWYLVCNAWSCVAIISLPVSPFRTSNNSHINVSSSPTSCLSTLLMYWSCSTLISLSVFKDPPYFLLGADWLFFVSLLSVDWFNFSVNFATFLILYFIFGWLLSWLNNF